jgi:hypothetical protein
MIRKMVQRSIASNAHGYREVNLEFRIARALALEADKVDVKKDRIRCPVLDASRSTSAYGMMALATTDQAGLDQWSEAWELPESAVELIAYLSGPWYSIIPNKIKKSFDDKQVNTGTIVKMKKGIHTGVLGEGFFDQDVFNNFIWTLHPNLKETAIDNAFLHSKDADFVYVGSDMLEVIMTHNDSKSNAWIKGAGPAISKFEMEKLLLGHMGQEVTLNPEGKPGETSQAISVRDMHDLYKYGVFPAIKEDQLLAAGLIKESAVAFTGISSSSDSLS